MTIHPDTPARIGRIRRAVAYDQISDRQRLARDLLDLHITDPVSWVELLAENHTHTQRIVYELARMVTYGQEFEPDKRAV